MDLFCNDKYWNKIEDKTSQIIPQIMKPELQRRSLQQLEEDDKPELIKQWGEYDFKFKLKAQGGSENQRSGS